MDKNSEERKLKEPTVGVIGGGYWGKNLIRVFNELGALKAICDMNETLMEDYKQKHQDFFCTSRAQDIICKTDIDAVIIATPASTHYELVSIALENGKSVFCEKPLALTEKQGEKLVELSEKKNLVLMVGHILHYHPAVIKLKQMVNQGELGDILYMYSSRTNIGRIRHEENILWSFAPHDISLILSLTKNLPIRVAAHGGIFLPHDVEDVTLTFLTFPGKIKAHVFVSWLNPFKEQKFVVVGEKKMAVFDDTEPENKLVLYNHKILWNHREVPEIEKAKAQSIPVEKFEPLKEEARHFLNCIVKKEKPLTDGREGLNVLRVLDMAEKSLREGR